MNEKQQQLTFERGITNVPSDAICSDSELKDCVGMMYDNGECRPIQTPVLYASGTPTILFVHRHANNERYIALDGTTIKWGTITNGTYTHSANICTTSGNLSVNAVGKVLVINDDNGIRYYLWKGDTYKEYSNDMPEILMDMWLVNNKELDVHENIIRTITCQELANLHYDDSYGVRIGIFTDSTDADKYDSWQSKIIGAISERINTLHKFGAFCFPFWIRYGIVLYDGSVTHLSAPILAMPTVLHGAFLSHTNDDGDEEATTKTVSVIGMKFVPTVGFGFLRMQLTNDVVTTLTNWKDIISGIRIYVSDEVKNFEMEGTWSFCNNVELDVNDDPILLTDSVCRNTWSTSLDNVSSSSWNKRTMKQINGDYANATTYILPTNKSEDKIKKELIDTSVFYQLLDIDVADLNTNVIVAEDIFGKNVLPTLTTRTQLESDDYFSHTKIKADYIFPYNNRINLTGITRTPFEGFHQFMLCETLNTWSFKILVYIEADGVELVVSHTATDVLDMMGKYFYYPDPRAKKAEIYNLEGGVYKLLYTLTLKEHPSLNGAYYFGSFPNDNDKVFYTGLGYYDNCYPASQNVVCPSITTESEILNGIIQTSEVDNPFLFLSKGVFNIGFGNIRAMSTITHALSQGQFGEYPLVVFADSGIWAAKLNDEGYFTHVRPRSREVILRENTKVLQTDDAVYFASKKGLMRIDGNGITCVSNQLMDIAPFLKTAFMAYDYRHSLIWIIGPVSSGSQSCYVFNMKTGTFTRSVRTQNYFISPVNLYPDTLLCVSNSLYSFGEIPNENVDPATYSGTMETRPLKLENALALKSILVVRHINVLSTGASIAFQIFASNNLKSWVEIKSLGGTPWKYYKFKYTFTNLKAVDSFAGTLLITQERRNLKLR